jgi:ankyrin repeat protein
MGNVLASLCIFGTANASEGENKAEDVNQSSGTKVSNSDDILDQVISKIFFDSSVRVEKRLEILKALAEQKTFDVNFKYRGDSLLHLASMDNDTLLLLQYLLNRGADMEIVNREGYTPLFNAIMEENREAVRLLIDNGANVNAKTLKYGSNPLHVAVLSDSPEIVGMLIDGGTDVNAKDNDGETPLDLVCKINDNKEIIDLLLQASSH